MVFVVFYNIICVLNITIQLHWRWGAQRCVAENIKDRDRRLRSQPLASKPIHVAIFLPVRCNDYGRTAMGRKIWRSGWSACVSVDLNSAYSPNTQMEKSSRPSGLATGV